MSNVDLEERKQDSNVGYFMASFYRSVLVGSKKGCHVLTFIYYSVWN